MSFRYLEGRACMKLVTSFTVTRCQLTNRLSHPSFKMGIFYCSLFFQPPRNMLIKIFHVSFLVEMAGGGGGWRMRRGHISPFSGLRSALRPWPLVWCAVAFPWRALGSCVCHIIIWGSLVASMISPVSHNALWPYLCVGRKGSVDEVPFSVSS